MNCFHLYGKHVALHYIEVGCVVICSCMDETFGQPSLG